MLPNFIMSLFNMNIKKSNIINHQDLDNKEIKKIKITELPIEIIEVVFCYLNLKDEFLAFGFCCKRLLQIEIELRNVIFKNFYRRSFPRCNKLTNSQVECYKIELKQRLLSPEIGDKIEALYSGKFKLDCMKEVYKGHSWWRADIIEKNLEDGLFKIRYPGWAPRWDEWVPRSRLRWQMEIPNPDKLIEFHENDNIEIWYQGTAVPGAWIESKIIFNPNKNEKPDMHLTTLGLIEYNRIRLIKKSNKDQSSTTSTARISARITAVCLAIAAYSAYTS